MSDPVARSVPSVPTEEYGITATPSAVGTAEPSAEEVPVYPQVPSVPSTAGIPPYVPAQSAQVAPPGSIGFGSAPPPTEDDFATVSQLEELRRLLYLEIRDFQVEIQARVESIIFTRLNEFIAVRFESRFDELNEAIEAIRMDMSHLRSMMPRPGSTASSLRQDVLRQTPAGGVGSAPPVRESTPRGDVAFEQGDVTRHGEVLHQPAQRLNAAVSELSQVVRQLQDGQGLPPIPPMATSQERPQGFTPPLVGTHSSGLHGVGQVPVGILADDGLGPPYPGIDPVKTLQGPFVRAVSYRAYRLRLVREDLSEADAGKVVKRADALRGAFPHLRNFSGKHPVLLLTFLKQFKAACDLSEIYEGLATRVVSLFLEEDAYRFYTTLTSAALQSSGQALRPLPWPVLVHRLLKRYCSEDALSKAYEKVTRARQRDNETESAFADRIHQAAIECGDVFDERTLVSYYISGLLPTVRYAIAESVLNMSEDVDLSVVRRMAVAAGETHRAQLAIRSGSRSRASPRAMVVEPVNDTVPTPQPFAYDSTPVMLLPTGARQAYSDTTSQDTEEQNSRELLQGISTPTPQSPRGVQDVRKPPPMTDRDAELALKMMTRNRGGYRCWGCRGDNHDLYNCPYLDLPTRMLFAKANYDYQAETLGPETANSHFRMRGFSPSRNRRGMQPTRRNVSIASPPVASTHSPARDQTSGAPHPKQPLAVVYPTAPTLLHAHAHQDSTPGDQGAGPSSGN